MEFLPEMLQKYNMSTLDEYKERHGDNIETELTFYQTFLIQTDHIPNKIIENMLEELADATLVNFVEISIKFIINIKAEYKEVLQARKYSRLKINEILQPNIIDETT